MSPAPVPQLPQATRDALEIWRAGVAAVQPRQLIAKQISVSPKGIEAAGQTIPLAGVSRLVVVGAGKASAAMAVAFENEILPQIKAQYGHVGCEGWMNCPEGSFQEYNTKFIKLFAARPAGVNLPTEKAVDGTQRILELVSECGDEDLVLCLLSGGGSALLTAPAVGLALSDKQAVSKQVAAAGGNIEQLNAVRRVLSKVKAGGLARACRAPRLATLVVSDVLGDPLETIASGPTWIATTPSNDDALQVLAVLGLEEHDDLKNVVEFLRSSEGRKAKQNVNCEIQHIILGNNALAVAAAEDKARELGYSTTAESAAACEGDVSVIAKRAAERCKNLINERGKQCWISGGEPTVQLPKHPGKGGRNQQLCLELVCDLHLPEDFEAEFAFASGGTDGEDGPTDAAGAYLDRTTWTKMTEQGLSAEPYLESANAYEFFAQTEQLLITGATGTNVCDLRVALVR